MTNELIDCINKKMRQRKKQEKIETDIKKMSEKRKSKYHKELVQKIRNTFGQLESGEYEVSLYPYGKMRIQVLKWYQYFFNDKDVYVYVNYTTKKEWYLMGTFEIKDLSIEQLQQIDLDKCLEQIGKDLGCVKE